MDTKEFSKRLRSVSHYEIIFTKHTNLRVYERGIGDRTIENHLRHPQCLKSCNRLSGPEKYKLWFLSNRRIAYIYIVQQPKMTPRHSWRGFAWGHFPLTACSETPRASARGAQIDDIAEKIIVVTAISEKL